MSPTSYRLLHPASIINGFNYTKAFRRCQGILKWKMNKPFCAASRLPRSPWQSSRKVPAPAHVPSLPSSAVRAVSGSAAATGIPRWSLRNAGHARGFSTACTVRTGGSPSIRSLRQRVILLSRLLVPVLAGQFLQVFLVMHPLDLLAQGLLLLLESGQLLPFRLQFRFPRGDPAGLGHEFGEKPPKKGDHDDQPDQAAATDVPRKAAGAFFRSPGRTGGTEGDHISFPHECHTHHSFFLFHLISSSRESSGEGGGK